MSKTIKNNKKMFALIIAVTFIILLVVVININALGFADFIALVIVAFAVFCAFRYTIRQMKSDKKSCGGCCSECSMCCSQKGNDTDETIK